MLLNRCDGPQRAGRDLQHASASLCRCTAIRRRLSKGAALAKGQLHEVRHRSSAADCRVQGAAVQQPLQKVRQYLRGLRRLWICQQRMALVDAMGDEWAQACTQAAAALSWNNRGTVGQRAE